eukprot:CAMPEP_0113666428 /NCGR_PEP_ID=MMETSP0038_2-20120614/2867_1 /TAXON_ID=2898 /ORGANISM="Cryptomonas paramecium" /LENGTH=41 /DNA_ID=CAMNT_0000581915 /DNA_START=248 /DNA_END=370 /DNA_ORIENTATION=- /assembly_acc=CAM_ASM_000170
MASVQVNNFHLPIQIITHHDACSVSRNIDRTSAVPCSTRRE